MGANVNCLLGGELSPHARVPRGGGGVRARGSLLTAVSNPKIVPVFC